MNYIYGSIYIFGKKIYNYLVSIPIIRNQNNTLVNRVEKKKSLYLQYFSFFSESNEIISNLYLGSSFNSYNLKELERKNINVILNITDDISNFYEYKNNIIYYKFPIRDNNFDDISEILNKTYDIIDNHINNGDTILVHCYMGASRSASVVIHYIMKKYGSTYDQSLFLVKSKRPIVNLTEKFYNTLKNLENNN